jgi:hypothetical protein
LSTACHPSESRVHRNPRRLNNGRAYPVGR